MKIRMACQESTRSTMAPLAPLRGEGPGVRGSRQDNLHRNSLCFSAPGPLIPSPSPPQSRGRREPEMRATISIGKVTCVILLLSLWISVGASATPPERFPGYSRSRLLRADSSLRAVAFSDGIACGDRGTILATNDGGQSWTLRNSGVDCRLSDLVWMDDRHLVIVGGGYDRITQISRAVVLVSNDGGNRWQTVTVNDLPRLTKIQRRDDRSLMAIGDWSNSMLTNRYLSHDDGKTWIADQDSLNRTMEQVSTGPSESGPATLAKWVNATGIPVVIRDACRTDDSTWFAVGNHGVILVSRDGGRSWRPSHGKGCQTSLLMVARNRSTVAWGLLGKEAIEHRNRVALLVHQPTNGAPGIADQVAVMLGGAGADLVRFNGSDIASACEQWIAIHRPSVVVLDQSLDVGVQDAFIKAATDANVPRVVVYRRSDGPTAIHRDALLRNSGILVSDCTTDAYQFAAPDRSVALSIVLQYHFDISSSARRGDSVCSGIDLQPGQKLTATLPPASRHRLQIVQARRSQFARMKKLMEASQSPTQFVASFKAMLDQTTHDDQFRLAWSILQETVSDDANSFIYQQALLDEIATRFPTSSAAHWAQLLSNSVIHSMERNRLSKSVGDRFSRRVSAKADLIAVSPFQEPADEIQQASAVAPLLVPKPDIVHFQSHAVEPTAEVDLAWEFHPIVLLTREAARQRGDGGQLQLIDDTSAELKRLARSKTTKWSALVGRGDPRSLVARRTTNPPKLDGVLGDDCWQSALSRATQTRIQMSYDDEFLYVAFECPKNAVQEDLAATKQNERLRDEDLTADDRLRLRIDTDCDLLTSFQFSVTSSGRTNDAVDGNSAWNPTWYRETRRDGGRLRVEMAILRRDLVDLPIQVGESWFISAQIMNAGDPTSPLAMPNPEHWMRVEFR